MVVRISEYDLLWKWIQDALVLVVIEDGDADVNVLFKALLREWQRTPLVKRWGSSEGSPQNPNFFKTIRFLISRRRLWNIYVFLGGATASKFWWMMWQEVTVRMQVTYLLTKFDCGSFRVLEAVVFLWYLRRGGQWRVSVDDRKRNDVFWLLNCRN